MINFFKIKRFIYILLRSLFDLTGHAVYNNRIDKNRSNSDDGLFLYNVKEAIYNEKKFNKFRNNFFWKSVVENTSYNEALIYLKNIDKKYLNTLDSNNKNIFEFLEKIDKLFCAKTFNFPTINKRISGNSIRYLKQSTDIKKKINSKKFEKVVEIGVGCGLQCLILDQLLQIRKYILVDVDLVLKLSKKFLENFILKLSYDFKTLNTFNNIDKYDLVISNYAFSELPKTLQLMYLDKIILRAKNGYLTMNTGTKYSYNHNDKHKHLSQQYLLSKIKNSKILEDPVNIKSNYIIYW